MLGRTPGLGTGRGLSSFQTQTQQLVQESQRISDISEEAQQIFIQVQKKINETSQYKPIDGIESFDSSLNDIEEKMIRAICHTLPRLGNEIDHGNEWILSAQNSLDESQYTHRSSSLHNNPSCFLRKYVREIEKQAIELKQIFKAMLSKSSETELPMDIFTISKVLQEQENSIDKCSAEIARINRKVDDIRMLSNAHNINNRYSFFSENVEQIREPITDTIKSSYSNFQAERRRLLEKHNTNELSFLHEQKSTGIGGLGRGLGGLGGGLGIGGGLGRGLNATQTKTTPAGITNQQPVVANNTSSILGTPPANRSSQQITPTITRATGSGLSGYQQNGLVPNAPKKGSSITV